MPVTTTTIIWYFALDPSVPKQGPYVEVATTDNATNYNKLDVSAEVPYGSVLIQSDEPEETYERDKSDEILETTHEEFKNCKIEGRGTKVWSSGNRFVGQWKNDVQHGTGV